MSNRQHIGVALSGGGHRASLFGLGALLYLVDARKGPEIAHVASVSGGGLTNGFIGAACDLTTVTPTDFSTHAAQLAHTVARGGTVWASPLTIAYLALTALPLVGAAAVSFVAPGPVIAVAWVAAVFLVGALAKLRSRVAAAAFDRALFHKRGLAELHTNVDHVMCATDLRTSRHAYFSGRFVHSYATGWGVPGELRLSRAVQASACLPGAFNPVSLPTAPHQFDAANRLRSFLLVDGGAYDNMGTEWASRLSQRITEGAPPQPLPHTVDELIVVNASAGKGDSISKLALVRVPVIGELMTLLASNSSLYNQSTAVRRRWIDLRFRGTRAGFMGPDGALSGAMVQIDRSPHALPNAIHGDDELGKRARRCRDLLGDDPTDWDAEAKANASVSTALSKIGAERASSLIRHAYVLTMVNAHIAFGDDYPLIDLPDAARLRAWVQ